MGKHRSSGSAALMEIADAVMRFDRRPVVDFFLGVALLCVVAWLMSEDFDRRSSLPAGLASRSARRVWHARVRHPRGQWIPFGVWRTIEGALGCPPVEKFDYAIDRREMGTLTTAQYPPDSACARKGRLSSIR